VCANKQYYPLRDGNHTCWTQMNCDAFVEAAVKLWIEWQSDINGRQYAEAGHPTRVAAVWLRPLTEGAAITVRNHCKAVTQS
jgi:hypothetical protein